MRFLNLANAVTSTNAQADWFASSRSYTPPESAQVNRSMMLALAIPPPSHIVCNPYRPPRCSSALTRVVMMRPASAQQVADRDSAAVDVGPFEDARLLAISILRPGEYDGGGRVRP
jgi:hypothetical protein